MNNTSSWLTPKATGLIAAPNHRLVRARTSIAEGELIVVFGGDVVTSAQLRTLSPSQRRRTLQVDEDHYIVSTREGPADWVNHSCRPNLGFMGQLTLVAMRSIATGEQLTFDYAMSDGSCYDEFRCRCGAPGCRTRVTGDDWRRADLWQRYGEYFSPYLRRRVAGLERAEVASHAIAAPERATNWSRLGSSP